MSSKRKRVVLSFTDKLKIVDQLKNDASGSSLARKYGVGNVTMTDIKNNSDVITNYASALDNEDENLYIKTMKMAENKDLDAVAYTWFLQLRSQGQTISGPLICEKALEINEKIGSNPDFKATTGLLMRFKSRHGIRQLDIQDEKLSANTQAAKHFKDFSYQKNLSMQLKSYQTANLNQNWPISLKKYSVFEECDQKSIQECDVDDPGYQLLTGDEIIESVVDDQVSRDKEEELRDDDQVDKGPPMRKLFIALGRL
ncbi:hypothetical protein LAZ67_10001884 [Cordylochernes scorpioides]|uniref:HTH CENPB-type domain-containing protein n=1 Tax=Cordylochernes scorpioides TaxID=51811 RepID=A0ABY6KW91_9ARAC|nr:hypothetical protein LAZ67_10001884 [Cordylochernes scorpioides]